MNAPRVVVLDAQGREVIADWNWSEWTDDIDAQARAIGGYVVEANSEPANILADFRNPVAPAKTIVRIVTEKVGDNEHTITFMYSDDTKVFFAGTASACLRQLNEVYKS